MCWFSVIGALAVKNSLSPIARLLAMIMLMGLTGCSQETPGLEDLPAEVLEVAPESGQTEPESLTVMSWNVQGSAFRSDPDYLKKVADLIRELSPDVVMLQEVHRNTKASGGLDQFEILSRSLRMNGCFGESLRIRETGSYGNAILTTATITDSRRVILPGRGEPRTILECRSSWRNTEIPLMTTHLTAWDRANRRTRALQTRAIETLLEASGSPLLILGGDFNAPLTSPEMVALAEGTFVTPVITDYVVTHPGTGRSYDHLFAGDGWEIEDGRIIQRGPSDHWPIISKLSPASMEDPL